MGKVPEQCHCGDMKVKGHRCAPAMQKSLEIKYRLQGWDDETVFLNIEEHSPSGFYLLQRQIDLSKHPDILQLVTDITKALLMARGIIKP